MSTTKQAKSASATEQAKSARALYPRAPYVSHKAGKISYVHHKAGKIRTLCPPQSRRNLRAPYVHHKAITVFHFLERRTSFGQRVGHKLHLLPPTDTSCEFGKNIQLLVEVIALLATLVFSCPNLDWSPIDHLETFAGQCAVTKAEWQAGRKAVPFEILVGGDCMDFCSPAGFANAVYQTLRTSPGGGALHAPVCSTWVFMSRGSTLRSPTRPLGRGDSQKVADGNLHVARCAVLCILAAAKGIFWLLEQPSTSIMETHPSFQKMLKILHVRKLIFDMKDFGANTQKRTILYSSHEEVDDLLLHKHPRKRCHSKEMVIRYTDSSGKSRCKGGRDLKMSQTYPREFGHALSAVRTKNLKKIKAKAKKFLRDAKVKGGEVDRNRRSNAHWVKHAKLMPVFEYLAGR
ncbi:unnamed protein product [Effrenium voratum]|uniref:Uncharacterized protein n=2 Tax=Effrenium voratum TaxID=2562239 RepID=A0AA36HN55_9DINO|nr:unnamed protein product [Effrenium voratum]